MAPDAIRKEQLDQLFRAAHKDPHLKMQLLENPERVAKQWRVVLEKSEIDRLRSVGAFMDLANEAQSGKLFRCDPRVCYPITIWQKQSLMELIKDLVVDIRIRGPKIDWVYYPAPDIINAIELKLDKKLGLMK